ncbi:putative enzyme [Sphingomonas sp. EC-HK361]|uniref:GNAT family N-acetyltransferase n=1 Tax=Sphingomonas sp. EC-HK361 TaxID=2038397 RepID=UPI0012519253|nr:GNAT family N-acetyltransferase [Sphingomonas sp. EC-HK361]VVT10325.1 putative enzyme [Sphingomonas sp. EC-HK361]
MIETARLILRPWRESDDASFFAMGQDAEVMRFLGPPTTLADVRSARQRMTACQAEYGYCFWALERNEDAAFIGFCGLKPAKPPIVGETEIGWRLARDAWGQGYAREAAEASLAWGWANLDVPAIAAITVPANARSWGLMERLGMVRDPAGDFDHPDLALDDPLRAHITYRITRPR